MKNNGNYLKVVAIEDVERTNPENGTAKKYKLNSLVASDAAGRVAPAKVKRTGEGYIRPAVAKIPGFSFYLGMILEGELVYDEQQERWDVELVEVEETVEAGIPAIEE
jgi:hypothetical protein